MSEQVRDLIIKTLHEEIVGPSTSLTLNDCKEGYDIPAREYPRSRYGAGILFPQKSTCSSQNDLPDDEVKINQDDLDLAGNLNEDFSDVMENALEKDIYEKDGDGDDYEIGMANEYLPSAMGLSCLVDVSGEISVVVEGAYYEKNNQDTGVANSEWKRIPFTCRVLIDSQKFADISTPMEYSLTTGESNPGLKLHVMVRKSPLSNSQDSRLSTFTLINTKQINQNSPKNQDCYFQCLMRIEGRGNRPLFIEYPDDHFREDYTDEEQELALLYRKQKVYAVGHGCSVDWPSPADGEDRVSEVKTSILPEYELFPTSHAKFDDLNLEMWLLGTVDKSSVQRELQSLIDKYCSWIRDREKELELDVPEHLHRAAKRNLDKCMQCSKRMSEGLDLLINDGQVWKAFQYMNRSMLMQHCHYILSTDPDKARKWTGLSSLSAKFELPNYEEIGKRRSWRPFQIAFILMSLTSIVKEDSKDREIVDVIWFPTGGGKTEAYLGLAAFSIFYKRLTHPESGGVTAIMRYTLRLLTTQQFQRAASLICAMEKIRQDTPLLGSKRITIGLWVGGSVTPNKEKDAITALSELIRRPGSKNVFLIKKCPWCGCEMGEVDIGGNKKKVKGYKKVDGRVRHKCEDPDCDFSTNELPIQIIDEHIYKSPPTLLIGTVDKFAMLPWIPEAKNLFALGEGNDLPPSLIIQDELHLISGPLGSMVGLYETLIDALCQAKGGVSPKIIGSTATVANASNQIEKLFGREESMLFPPQGLSVGDSFFAHEDKSEPGRKYVGVFATGLPSQMTAMVRVLASLIQAPLLGGYSSEEVDPYWTNLVYFNSVRELGHACTLLRGDVPEYLNVISNMRLNLNKDNPKKRYIRHDKELTSRVSSEQVAETLDNLFKSHHTSNDAIDVCLATNMIQVGLDVSRLSLMLIAGQPKTTSEYIQASSRVGRGDSPGLVVTLLNPAKSRDRSHYEGFKAYHQRFYKYVEPTSVTPFAPPVRDRALHALVITLVRYLGSENNNKYAGEPVSGELKNRVNSIISDRVKLIDPEELGMVLNQLEDIWKKWDKARLIHGESLLYGKVFESDKDSGLMLAASAGKTQVSCPDQFLIPTSMRNVDSTCEVKIVSE